MYKPRAHATRLEATSAAAGRQALHPTRLLHYDLTAGSVTVQAVADHPAGPFPAAGPRRRPGTARQAVC